MAKLVILFVLTFFLVFTLSFAARGGPAFPGKPQPQGATVETEQATEEVEVENNCAGVGEEDCLMRRTLAAHVDYIYTQNHKP